MKQPHQQFSVSRYQIDRQEDFETNLALYRTVFTWAGQRGDHFVLGLELGVYDTPEESSRLLALGQEIKLPKIKNWLDRLLTRLSKHNLIQIQGVPNESFIYELTRTSAPPHALAGDESPVDYVIISIGNRPLYVSYDYGTVQSLDLTNDELGNLRQALIQAGLNPDSVTSIA